ncbi:MAG: EAL domain-containing protein, partial [Lachnospiraceae bacterium]|nr:EAL domain-containing protein [Lachnospiraceae bacterium]
KDSEQIKRLVLIVDDEFINREILGGMLREEYRIVYAVNGKEALEIIRESASTLSMILLDLMMPEMTGYELMEILKADEALKHIPVIVLTSEKDAEVKSLKLGASDFIKKPYESVEIIKARIMRIIELSEDRSFIRSAERDELTGLYSRTFFYEYAGMMDRYNSGMKTDAAILNVEHFHMVNEMYGRSFGDKVLIAIGDAIKDYLTETEGLACRSEADNFFIYMAHHDDYEGLLEHVNRKISELSKGIHLHVRIGVYPRVEHDIEMDQRFSCARYACNTLRGNYIRYVAFYDMTMRERSVFNERMINDIHDALEKKQFKVYYQPKYNIEGEEPVICSAEALVRWEHPEYGTIKPETFLHVFEENGLISILDRFVWKETIEQIGRWREKSITDIPVSVNVSRIDLYDEGLPDYLMDLLEGNGLLPGDLLLEITESACMDDNTQFTEAIENLRREGFRIEMDDFGSGYSSLNVITTMPIYVIKLDMRFIEHIHEDSRALLVVKLIMDMAGSLGVPVVAEGVEIAEQFDLLKENGCSIIQGYYFSRALSVEEFEEEVLSFGGEL